MQVRVVYHEGVKELTGTNVEMVHLDESATAASLLSRLGDSHPKALSQLTSFQLGRGGQAITQDAFLSDGDIIYISLSEQKTA